jgi:hypothetical protein
LSLSLSLASTKHAFEFTTNVDAAVTADTYHALHVK